MMVSEPLVLSLLPGGRRGPGVQLLMPVDWAATGAGLTSVGPPSGLQPWGEVGFWNPDRSIVPKNTRAPLSLDCVLMQNFEETQGYKGHHQQGTSSKLSFWG